MSNKDIIITHWNANSDFAQTTISAPTGPISYPQAIGYNTSGDITKFYVLQMPSNPEGVDEAIQVITQDIQQSELINKINELINYTNQLTSILSNLGLLTIQQEEI